MPIAINVGDAMNALSIGSLIENIPVLVADLPYRISHEAHHLMLQTVEGQAFELGWTRTTSSILLRTTAFAWSLRRSAGTRVSIRSVLEPS